MRQLNKVNRKSGGNIVAFFAQLFLYLFTYFIKNSAIVYTINLKGDNIINVRESKTKQQRMGKYKMTKLTPAQQEIMNKIYASDYLYKEVGAKMRADVYTKNGWDYNHDGEILLADKTVKVILNTRTLNSLEKKGAIKVVNVGGTEYDKVEVLGHEFHDAMTEMVKTTITTPDHEYNFLAEPGFEDAGLDRFIARSAIKNIIDIKTEMVKVETLNK